MENNEHLYSAKSNNFNFIIIYKYLYILSTQSFQFMFPHIVNLHHLKSNMFPLTVIDYTLAHHATVYKKLRE